MKRTPREKLLNPAPGSKIAAARDFGIDLTLLVENLRLTPAERVKKNDALINDMVRFEAAVTKAKREAKLKIA